MAYRVRRSWNTSVYRYDGGASSQRARPLLLCLSFRSEGTKLLCLGFRSNGRVSNGKAASGDQSWKIGPWSSFTSFALMNHPSPFVPTTMRLSCTSAAPH